MRLTRSYQFSASHRLHTPALSEEENRRLYDKCNNPFGHGHNYELEITVEGAPGADGQIVNREKMDHAVKTRVLNRIDHRDLNRDIAEFKGAVTTTENLAVVVRQLLLSGWNLPAKLVRIQIRETARNTFAWEASQN